MKTSPRLLSLFVLFSVATLAAAQTGPVLVIQQSILNAGIVPSGAQITQTFVLENRGDSDLEILGVQADCGCTVVRFDQLIVSGGRGEITAEVDVSSFVGPIAKYVTVLTNDPVNPEVTLTIKAEVRPDVQAFPGYARFLTVVDEGEMTAEQTVWASSFENFEIVSASSPYDHVEVTFHEASEDEERPEGEGRQWRVVLTLSADAPVGPMADHVTLVTNHPDKPAIRIPVSGFVRPILAVSPPIADFGLRDLTGPIMASVHVKNFSEQEISLTSVSADLPELEVEIDPDGRDHYVIIRLNPGLGKGEFTGLLTVETDSPDIPILKIEVRGTIL